MNKIILNISLTNKKSFSFFEKGINISLDSLDSLKSFLSGSFNYLDFEKELREECFIKYDFNDSETELYIKKRLNDFNYFYQQIINGNYTFNYLDICDNNKIAFEDIKSIIISLKDRIRFINMNNLDINIIYKILKDIEINNKVNIITKYNYFDSCTKKEILELMDFLNNTKYLINRYNLSPFEICIFVNDLIKERPYKENNFSIDNNISQEEIWNNSVNSRSIMKVLKNDEIVCAGFSNLFSAVLDYVGIKSITIDYVPKLKKENGHMANIVYINDNKYNVNGLYEIDTTAGRVYTSDGAYDYKKSLQNYYHFARPLDKAFSIKQHNNLEPEARDFQILKYRIDRIDMNYPEVILKFGLDNIVKSCIKIQNKFHCDFLDKEIKVLNHYINNCNNWYETDLTELEAALSNIMNKIFVENPLLSFQKALYRVKLIEHSIDKYKFPLTKEILDESYHSRIIKEELLFDSIYRNQVEITDKEKLEIARSELISVLHKLAKDNVDKNPLHHK